MSDAKYQDQWERVRILATIVIQPHVKQKLTAEKLLPFPWDPKRSKNKTLDNLTLEERRKRAEEIKNKLGQTI